MDRICLEPELHRSQRRYEIELHPHEVPGLLRSVQENADSQRQALGFLPSQAYEQAATDGGLFVVVERLPMGVRYAGHILFGQTYPRAKIFQIFVPPADRKHGVGRLMIERLIEILEERSYLTVTARVAADLPANAFWEASKFEIVGTRSGGVTRGRTINIRVRQLNTPALFGYREPVSGIPLTEPLPNLTTVFALDLNVFFDVAKRRPRAEYGAIVMGAAFNNIVRLTVTEEFANELRRSTQASPDPVLEFALALPTLPAPPGGISEQLIQELAMIVFPERAAAKILTAQDRSDLSHIVIAAHHKLTGFITAEDALVRASAAIEEKLGLKIVHVKDLAEALQAATKAASPLDLGFSDKDLRMTEISAEHSPAICALVESATLPVEYRTLALAEGVQAGERRSLAIAFNDSVICAAFWQPQSTIQGGIDALLLTDEDEAASPIAVNAVLNRLSRIACERGPARVQVVIPNSTLTAQDIAIRYGYTRCSNAGSEVSRYQRLAVGTVVDAAAWPSTRQCLHALTDMRFAADLESIADDDFRIQFQHKDGKEYVIDLFDLETVLSPTLFLFANRSAVIVPIRAAYADDLLGTAAQGSLLPKPQAAVLHERTYFSSARNERLFVKGAPLVFYESGKATGRSSAIAIARVTSTVIVPKSQIAASLLDGGVVDEEEIGGLSSGERIAATTVDNILKLRRPVPFARLRALGCADGANLVTSRRISSHQLQMIISEGQGTCE